MPFRSGSISYRRFAVTGAVPNLQDEALVRSLRESVLGDLEPMKPGEIHVGFTGGRHLFDRSFAYEHIAFGSGMHLGARIDTVRVPPDIKKAYKKARCMGLSQHAGNGSLGIFEAGSFDTPKTKDALKLVEGWSVAPLVVVVGSEEEAAALSFRNIPRSAVLTPTEVGLTELPWARRLLISTTALDELSASLDSSKQKDEVTA